MATQISKLDDDGDVQDLAAAVLADPDQWMDTPHPLLGGYRPQDLIGTNHEQQLRDLLRSIKYGMPS